MAKTHKYVWISDLQSHLVKGKPYFMSDNTRPDPETLKTWNYTSLPWPVSEKLVEKSVPGGGWKFNTSGKSTSCKGPCGCQSFPYSPWVTNTVKSHFTSLLEQVKVKCGWGEAITSAGWESPFWQEDSAYIIATDELKEKKLLLTKILWHWKVESQVPDWQKTVWF